MPEHSFPLMLFAAGFGTRMGKLTANRPKPLIKVAGRALIDHALDLADAAGVAHKIVNLHYLPEQIRGHLAHRDDIVFSPELPQILETGGGLRHAAPLLGQGPVITLNTDAIWTGPNPLATLIKAWRPDIMDALLMLVEPDQATGHTGAGDFAVAPDGTLTRGPGAIYTGAQIIRTDMLADVQDVAFSLNLIWDRILAQGRLYGIFHSGKWCDVGQPESIPLAETMLQGRDV